MNTSINPKTPEQNTSKAEVPARGGIYTRQVFLSVLKAAIMCKEFRYSREASLHWLSVFPGDLEVSLMYARALIGEGCNQSAVPILKGLCQADPEYLEAIDTLVGAEHRNTDQDGEFEMQSQKYPNKSGLVSANNNLAINWYWALQGESGLPDRNPSKKGSPKTPEPWGTRLWHVRNRLELGDQSQAEHLILSILGEDPATPLVAVTHLKILDANTDAPIQSKRSLAEHYHRRWPDCLACMLYLANWQLIEGASSRAVNLLHEASARDISGQVAIRLWGEKFPFRNLWPDHLELNFDLQIPASVAATLGWNRLTAVTTPAQANQSPDISDAEENLTGRSDSSQESQSESDRSEPTNVVLPIESLTKEDISTEDVVKSTLLVGAALSHTLNPTEPDNKYLELKPDRPETMAVDETILVMNGELKRLASKMKRLDLAAADGRLPVYVIFTVHSKLLAKFGSQATANLIREMQLLAQSIQTHSKQYRRTRWDARLFLADLPESTTPLGISPARSLDPWGLKLTLTDLEAALTKRGERIGALLIVGGPDIVPFHNLPNPVDDQDRDVPSDNPYASRDDNYFIPEWPVGRVPEGADKNTSHLTLVLRRIQEQYNGAAKKSIGQPSRWWDWFFGWLRPARWGRQSSFGYTAAIWRQASLSVFNPIGEPGSLLVSPPMSVNGNGPDGKLNGSLPIARLGYFNLHGLSDAAEWYGQRDPLLPGDGPDYPVALRPQDIRTGPDAIPRFVFSEACFGAYIQDKTIDQAIALQFLASGSLAVAGSSCMSYGSIIPPLIGADLLGFSFWNFLSEGFSAGEALQRAKIQLANDMHQRQGYLDGEDQKTLISFMLYGDPLAQLSYPSRKMKKSSRLAALPKVIKMICDRAAKSSGEEPIPNEITAYVKQLVSNYLPGMSDAELIYTAERATCESNGHTCPTSQFKSKAVPDLAPKRHLIILSKQVQRSERNHPQVARLTLDAHGKLVKMAVSR